MIKLGVALSSIVFLTSCATLKTDNRQCMAAWKSVVASEMTGVTVEPAITEDAQQCSRNAEIIARNYVIISAVSKTTEERIRGRALSPQTAGHIRTMLKEAFALNEQAEFALVEGRSVVNLASVLSILARAQQLLTEYNAKQSL